jgi:hypothetical protein
LSQPCKIKDNKKIGKHMSKERSEGPKNRKQTVNKEERRFEGFRGYALG